MVLTFVNYSIRSTDMINSSTTLQDDLLNANARLCYAEKWLFARFESLELQLDEPRAPAPRFDHEQRVHDELLRAFQLQIKVNYIKYDA